MIMPTTIDKQSFEEEGLAILRSLLTDKEVCALKAMLMAPDGARKWAFSGTTKMSSFQAPGDDILGRLARSERMHEAASVAVGGTANLHHVQVVFKEPHSSYEFAWHQDYGYQFHSMILLPAMCTIFVAVDPCHPQNGGLEVISRSHACGRLNHVPRGPTTRQLTIEQERVDALLADSRFERRQLSLDPGDAVIFHCNLVHRSLPNNSDATRYALNIAYNRVDNVVPGSLRMYSIVKDEDVIQGGATFLHDTWPNVIAIPYEVHEKLEALRAGEGGGGEEEVVFVAPTEVVSAAVNYKAMALKLKVREEGKGGPEVGKEEEEERRLVVTLA